MLDGRGSIPSKGMECFPLPPLVETDIVAHSLFIWNDYHKLFSGVNVLEHEADYSLHLTPSVRILCSLHGGPPPLCIFSHKEILHLHYLLCFGDINTILVILH
jgi:hypothetical protein